MRFSPRVRMWHAKVVSGDVQSRPWRSRAVEKTACAHVEGFGKKLDGDRPLPVGFDIFFGQPDLPRFDRFGRLPQQMTEIVPPGLQQ